jgi:hypothetical protein
VVVFDRHLASFRLSTTTIVNNLPFSRYAAMEGASTTTTSIALLLFANVFLYQEKYSSYEE